MLSAATTGLATTGLTTGPETARLASAGPAATGSDSDQRSQVVVLGRGEGTRTARDYWADGPGRARLHDVVLNSLISFAVSSTWLSVKGPARRLR